MNVTELVEWLRAKYRRHGEIEDQQAADALEAQAREIADLQAGWQRTYDHDVARLQERLAAAERERDKWIEESARLGYNAEQFKAERDELIGMREEVLHYQREFHRLRDERDNFFCKVCGTESEVPALCSGCGGLMTALTGKHLYAIEIMDMATCTSEPVIYERRGPFGSVLEADSWWHRHSELPKYVGCEAYTVILEAPGEVCGN